MLTLTAMMIAAAIHPGSVARTIAARPARPDTIGQFPRVEGTNLEGRRFSLPADFAGALNVVIVAFRREQQDDVNTWMPFLRDATASRQDVRVYELPTLNSSYRLVRSFIDGGMARGIPSRTTREATITLYIDKTPFKAALAIGGEDHITTLLVARDGRVLWRADGPYSPAAAAGLAITLHSLPTVQP
jgi:hypothetical protein